MDRKYTVYKHTSPEGKVYIGCTSLKPERRFGSRYRKNLEFYEDIKRFGWDNFKHEIIESNMNETDAYNLEKELIHKYNSTDRNHGYNKSTGGKTNSGYHFPEDAKRKLREANLGKHHTEETKRKISKSTRGDRHPMFGKHHTEESKRKMSESHIGIRISEDTKEKIRVSGIGKHHTEETKRKLSEARRGEGNPMYGKHPSEETRRKLSDARKGRKHEHHNIKRNRIGTYRKKVMCVETGKIYESVTKASTDTGWSISYISSVCNGDRDATGGYHWVYVN